MRHRILVPRLADPTVLCESDAVAFGEGRFRLVGSAPRQERLLFKRGEIVECEIRTLPDGSNGLVAARSVSADPEFQKKQRVFAICGVLVGAALGGTAGFWIEISPAAIGIGSVIGAALFGYCSTRWGDSAWVILGHALKSEWLRVR
jgi:hypothetical protein